MKFTIEAETKTSLFIIEDDENKLHLRREEIFSENYNKHIIVWKIKDKDTGKYIELGPSLSSLLEESLRGEK